MSGVLQPGVPAGRPGLSPLTEMGAALTMEPRSE